MLVLVGWTAIRRMSKSKQIDYFTFDIRCLFDFAVAFLQFFFSLENVQCVYTFNEMHPFHPYFSYACIILICGAFRETNVSTWGCLLGIPSGALSICLNLKNILYKLHPKNFIQEVYSCIAVIRFFSTQIEWDDGIKNGKVILKIN